MKGETGDLGDPRRVASLQAFFANESKILEEIQAIVAEREEPFCDVLFPLLYSIVDASRAILLLSERNALRSAYVIARVAFETIVNAGFILTRGHKAAERARSHARQKAFRDLDRELEINGHKLRLTCSAKDKMAADREVQASLAMFTNKKGREITQWTEETLKERIEEIGAKHGPKAAGGLMFGLLAVYRHGSEIAHGTLFGALFSLGLTLPGGPKSGDQLERFITITSPRFYGFWGERSIH